MSSIPQRATVRTPVLIAVALLALILTFLVLARPAGEPSAAPSPTASAPTSLPSTTASATGTAATSPAAAGAKPDAQHGLITRTPAAIRSEADPAALNKVPNWNEGAAIGVSPDGKRVAVLRSGQTGQGIISFTTAKPDDITYVMDMAGTGELIVGPPVWAADGSDSLLVGVIKPGAPSGVEPPPAYSALRSIDITTRRITELARTTNTFVMLPVVWHPAGIATAYETGPGGFAINYVVVRGQQVTRTSFAGDVIGGTVKASQDGMRVLAIYGREGTSIRWWPYERIDQQNELKPLPGDSFYRAEWRPRADEVVIAVGPAAAGRPRTMEENRLEVWGVRGGSRNVRQTGGFSIVRVDGTGTISRVGSELQLTDLATGATTKLPRGADSEQPYLAVLF